MTDSDTNPVSRILAKQVVAIASGSLGADADHAFARVCTDFATCAVLGASTPVAQATRRYFARTDLGRQATLFGAAGRLSPASAAFVNATGAHSLDYDDGHTQAGGHPGASVFPAVLATAEEIGAAPDQVINAVVAGYHMMVRVAMMMHPHSARTGWHNTAVAGTFGATAAVSALLRLDVAQTAHAFGLAGSFAGGLLEFLAEGPDVKRIHPGMAARDGINCAGLAREGLTGPSRIFEGRHGVSNAFIDGKADYSKLDSDALDIENVYFKLYPCCRHYHAAIDGILALRDRHGLRPADIRHVQLGLYGVAVRGHDHKRAKTMLGAQMSAPIAAGLAVLEGAVTVGGFQPDSLARTELQSAIDRVDVAVDDQCEQSYPNIRSGAVSITTTDGKVFDQRVSDPKGEAANPLTDADLETKFRANCDPILGGQASAASLQIIWNFRNEPSALSRLLQQLTPAGV